MLSTGEARFMNEIWFLPLVIHSKGKKGMCEYMIMIL